MNRGWLVTALHLALVLSLAGKYYLDRVRLPRVWARTANFDPNLPIRGRYMNLRAMAALEGPCPMDSCRADLVVREGRLVARSSEKGSLFIVRNPATGEYSVSEPLAFFLPEHAQDPSTSATGEELWVELNVPPKGPPRPIQLGVRRHGNITPLGLR